MTDQTNKPTNGDHPTPPKPTCAVTLVMLPDGSGMGIQVHEGSNVERTATPFDLTSLAAHLSQFCQARENLQAMAAMQQAGPKVIPIQSAPKFNPFRRG